MKKIVSELMSQNGFWMLNKTVAKHLGNNDAALLLSHLVDLQEKLFGGKEFFQQQDRMIEECNLTKYSLRVCIELLVEKGLLTVEKKGLPAKNHYKVNLEAILEIFEHVTTSGAQKGTTSDNTPSASHLTTSSGPQMGTTSATQMDTTKKRINKKSLEIENKVIDRALEFDREFSDFDIISNNLK